MKIKTFASPLLLSIFILISIYSKSQKLEPEKISYTFAIYFDNNWKVISIGCRDTSNKIFPKQNSVDGSIIENEHSSKFLFSYFVAKNERQCKISFLRLIALTNDEATSYQKYKKTTLSVRSSIRDYYCTFVEKKVVDLQNKESINCEQQVTQFKYHALFNPNTDYSKNAPVQSYMQKGSFMAITKAGLDSIVTEGYTAFLNEDGSPKQDLYLRHYGDFTLTGSCSQYNSGRGDDVYFFTFQYRKREYLRIVSGNLYKACFLTDPNDSKNSMAMVVREDGSVDYIVGELEDLYTRYFKDNLPRIETNTTAFVKTMISKYPNLLLWSILKPTRNLPTDVVKFGEITDVSEFAMLLQKSYLINQSLWGTLIDNNGTWTNSNSDELLSEVFF